MSDEENQWIEDVMTTVNTSLNDLCVRKLETYIKPQSDQIYDSPIRLMKLSSNTNENMVDISDGHQCNFDASINDQHITFAWEKYSDKWRPPPEPDPNEQGIVHQLQHNHKQNLQSDSGANRTVVDNIKLLTDVQSITPTNGRL